MKHKLASVAIGGIAVFAICLGAAAAIGGRDIGNGLDFDLFGDRPDCAPVAGATATSRDLDWDGSDHAAIGVPARAQYSPQNGPRVHVTGDPQILAHLRVRHGAIELDCRNSFRQHLHPDETTLDITLPGRAFQKFAIYGSGRLLLQKLDQPDVSVAIAGSGTITADGQVGHAKIGIAGSGNADLGQVTARTASVHIAGSGDTDIAPSDEADIDIAGSGDVNLHTSPKRIETHIAGSGRIRNVGAAHSLDKDGEGI